MLTAVTSAFMQGARQDHIDGTFQGWAHFGFYIRNLVSELSVHAPLELAGSGPLQPNRCICHPCGRVI